MHSWGSGYVTDVEYEDGFYPSQGPEHLALAATINGLESPDVRGKYTYCELGCGRGQTTLVHAAINPDAEYHAVDFHPAHVAYAQAQARAASIKNVTFHECSFEQLASSGGPTLPQFDFVTMYGVWSWIAPALQQSILDFLSARLKPGALVHVSYNAMPSWYQVAPLQRVIRELAAAAPERSDFAVARALEQVGRLATAKIIPQRFTEALERATDSVRRLLPYLAHEYLNEHWQPVYHVDVVRAFGRAKLTFAACSDLLLNFYNLWFTDEQRELLNDIPFPELRETLKDFCAEHWFRQDVFVRGARRMTAKRREQLLQTLGLALLRPRPDVIEIARPSGSAWRPDVAVYQAVTRALERGPQQVSSLLSLEELPRDHRVGPVELVGVLVGTGLAGIHSEPTAAERAGADRLNALLDTEEGAPLSRSATFAVPALRSGITLSSANYALYRSVRSGENPDAAALARDFIRRCRENNGHPVVDGKTFEDEVEARDAVTKDYATKIERLVPIWRNVGLV